MPSCVVCRSTHSLERVRQDDTAEVDHREQPYNSFLSVERDRHMAALMPLGYMNLDPYVSCACRVVRAARTRI